jgi:hypothetical protein
MGATVFENSTACAPDGLPYRPFDVRPGSTLAAFVVVRPEIKQYPVEAPGLASVYWRPEVGGAQTNQLIRE